MIDRYAVPPTPHGVWEPAPAALFVRRPAYPWLVVAVCCIGAFIGQLDASIVQLALPALEREFDTRLGAVSWVAIGYQLAFTAILPIYARLAEIGGRKLIYLLAFALFGVFSLLCGMANALWQLILFRILLGVAGAGLGANSVVVLVKAVGPERQGHAMGIFAAAQAVGISLGPLAGGVLLGTLGWRWVFWVTVPFAAVAAVGAWLLVPRTTDINPDRRFDLPGALLLIPALAALLLLISESYAWGLTSPPLLACWLAVMVLLPAFVWRQNHTTAPLIDLALFQNPAFSGGVVAIVMSYALLYGMFFLMSFALMRGYHDQPLTAGARLAIVPVALGIVAPFTGLLQKRLGRRVLLLGGMALCCASNVMLLMLMDGAPATLPAVMVMLALFGAGLGLFIAPNNSETMSAAPPDHRGQAGGMLNLMRVLGTSVGVASASALLTWRLAGRTGVIGHTTNVPEQQLLASIADGLWLLIGFAVIAALMAILRGEPLEPPAKPT
nr:MFS transporter [uncultured Rhodopila sp.]